MATHFTISALFLLISANYAVAVDFTCPTEPITRQSGTFPKDQLTLTMFPNNYNCKINFQIEDGFVFKLTIVANVTDGSGESLVVTDALEKQRTYTAGVSAFFAPAKTASLQITTNTGNSQFWFRYEYNYMAFNEHVMTKTGTPFSLVLTSMRYYTFFSPNNDNVVINTATVDDISSVDISMRSIYVYDGIDIKAPYVGNLYDYVMSTKLSKSTGNATTLANFYGTPTNSFALANDYKSITPYDTYTFVAYTKNVTIPKNFMDGISNTYTFFCLEKNKSFLTNLNFGSNSFKADVRPFSPTDSKNALLSYVSTQPVSLCMPQMIPGNLFTVGTLGPELSFTLSSTADNWLTPYTGRMGYIFSDSLWYLNAYPSYNYTFESSQLMTFTFNFQSVIIHQAGEMMNVKVGIPGSQPASVTYTSTVTNPQTRVANGTYLTASYTGEALSSSSIISFQMINADGTGPTTNAPITTTSRLETTTKAGGKFELFVVFVAFVMTFL